jgi:hypothetical protein
MTVGDVELVEARSERDGLQLAAQDAGASCREMMAAAGIGRPLSRRR